MLDLSAEPLIRAADLPQGYLAPGADPLEQTSRQALQPCFAERLWAQIFSR